MTRTSRPPWGRRAILLGTGFVVCLTTGAMPAQAQQMDGLTAALALEQAFVDVIEQAESSVVSISRVKTAPRSQRDDQEFNPFGIDFRRRERLRDSRRPGSSDFIPDEFGSGIIIALAEASSERFILTNYHVVKGGPVAGQPAGRSDYRLYVRLSDRRGFEAHILAADPRSDLAVLEIDETALGIKASDLKPLVPAAEPEFKKGRFVLALGNPYAMGRDGSASAAWGMIGNIARRPAPLDPILDEDARKKETIHHYGTLLQIDARLDVGTSGGALLNLQGELIGITTSLAALEGYEKSVGYAIPFDEATRRVIHDLVQGHEVEYGFLGVEPTDVDPEELELQLPSGEFKQTSAARAASVHPNSPAFEGGLQADDVILEVNGEPVLGRYDLMRLVGQQPPGATVRLRVWRDRARRELTLTAKLGKYPVIDDEGIIATNPRYPDWRGLTVDFPTGRQKHLQFPFRYYEAVVVTDISDDDQGRRSGLQVGDFVTHVDGTSVRTPAEFHKAVEGLRGEVTLTLVDGRKIEVPDLR